MAFLTTVSNSSVNVQHNFTTTATVAPNMSNPGAGNHPIKRESEKTQSAPEQLQEIVQNLAGPEQLLEIVQNLGHTTISQNHTKKEPLTKEPRSPNHSPSKEDKHIIKKCECVKTQSAPYQLQEIVQNLANTTLSRNSQGQIKTTTTTQIQTKKDPHTPNKAFKAEIQPLHSSPSHDPNLELKPVWHADVHRLLNQLARRNQEVPILAPDIQQVRTWAHEVMASKNPDDMRMFLKLLSQYYFLGAKQIAFEVLKTLRKVTPEINQYFKDIPKEYLKDLSFDEASEGPVLSTLGIRHILRMQEGAFGYPTGMLGIAGVTELPSLIDDIMQSPSQDMIQGWVVENDLFRQDHHIVPVLALKVKGKTHIFIFDSLGHNLSDDPNERQLSFVLEDLIQSYRKQKSIEEQLALYSYKNKRQHALSLDCVTFSLLDLKNLIERHVRGADDLLTFYAKQDPKNQPRSITSILAKGSSLPIFEIDILPPELMKVTQSKKQIQAYVENSPALNSSSVPVFQRFTPLGQILESPQTLPALTTKVSENERVRSDEKAMNLYVDRQRIAHIVYVLALHAKEKKLAQSSSSSSSSTSSISSTSTSSTSSTSSPPSSSQQRPVKRMLKFKPQQYQNQ